MCVFKLNLCPYICSGVGSLAPVVTLLWAFWGTSIRFCIVTAPFHTSTSSVGGFPVIHTFASTYCLWTLWWCPFWPYNAFRIVPGMKWVIRIWTMIIIFGGGPQRIKPLMDTGVVSNTVPLYTMLQWVTLYLCHFEKDVKCDRDMGYIWRHRIAGQRVKTWLILTDIAKWPSMRPTPISIPSCPPGAP